MEVWDGRACGLWLRLRQVLHSGGLQTSKAWRTEDGHQPRKDGMAVGVRSEGLPRGFH